MHTFFWYKSWYPQISSVISAAMVFHILEYAGLKPSVITGAGLTSLVKKGLIGNAKNDVGEWLVIEADESDGSFLNLKPNVSILNNLDPEHLDHYGNFDNLKLAFKEFYDKSNNVVWNIDDKNLKSVNINIKNINY